MNEFLQSLQTELDRQHRMAMLENVGLLLAAGLVFGFFSAQIARARGRHVALWFLAGLLFGPLGLVVGFFPVNQHGLEAREHRQDDPHGRSELGLSERISVGGLIGGLLLLMVISG